MTNNNNNDDSITCAYCGNIIYDVDEALLEFFGEDYCSLRCSMLDNCDVAGFGEYDEV